MTMTDITALGEILIDLTQSGVNAKGVPEYAANPGGAPANLAVAATRLGAKAAFVGKVGNDSFGNLLKRTLSDNGVDISGLATDDKEATTLAVVSVDESGERSFSFYRDPSADVNLRREDVPESLLDAKFFHFGSVSLTADPARDTTLWAAARAKERGAWISYDPNYRPSLWQDQETALTRMKQPLPMVDILKVSDEELLLLTGADDISAGAAILAAYGISLVLVNLGAEGAFYRFSGGEGRVSGVPCVVGDTNGAGDTFLGAVLAQLAARGGLESMEKPELERIIAFANKAASITASRHGAIPAMPDYREVFG